ncbi:MAG: hypothetical protein PHD37_18085, partial [Gallionellaceae bacterium]|nr:hypothetical protein [Gallionellaceae bacterium]
MNAPPFLKALFPLTGDAVGAVVPPFFKGGLGAILFRYVVMDHNSRILTLKRGHDGENAQGTARENRHCASD